MKTGEYEMLERTVLIYPELFDSSFLSPTLPAIQMSHRR